MLRSRLSSEIKFLWLLILKVTYDLEPKAKVIRSLILKHTWVCHITCFSGTRPKESVQHIFNYSSKRCSQLRLVWLRHKLCVCLLLFKLHPEQLNYSIALHHHNGQTASSPQTALLQALILGQMRSKIQKLICRQFFTVDVVDNIKQSFYSKHLLYFFKEK